MKIKHIYWFAYYNLDSPSVRYRGKYPLDFLKANYGVDFSFVIPGYSPAKILSFLKAYFSALLTRRPGSLIVIQRVHSNFIYSNLLKILVRLRRANTVYDIDDADYLEHPPETIYYFVKNCGTVFVGSKELQNNFSRLNKNVILNTSPVPDLQIVRNGKNDSLTIGWIGDFAGGHREGLVNSFFPALKALPFKVKFIMLGVHTRSGLDFLADYFRNIPGVELVIPQDIDWKNEADIQERISGFDIGVATLLDTELHRSKSAFKLKQYFNNGVPVLSSPVPENSYFVDEGRNGFLCATPEDFRKRIIEIEEMSDTAYNSLSAAALNSRPEFNLDGYAETLLSAAIRSVPVKTVSIVPINETGT